MRKKESGEHQPKKKQKEADTKSKAGTTNEEKDEHKTLSSLRTKQKWNYPNKDVASGECKERSSANKEQPFDNGNKGKLWPGQKAVEAVQSPT